MNEAAVDQMHPDDWPRILEIYLEGLATGQSSFETRAPTWDEWNTSHHAHSRIVVRYGGQVTAWAALSPVSNRACYVGVAEISIYVAAACRGRGVGKLLLGALIKSSERNGIWTLLSSIFPENEASIRLHEACGFRKVGLRERIARHFETWRDTIILERRSKVVGID